MSTTTGEVSLRIRVGMDVYDSYGDRYLGSVVRLWHGPHRVSAGTRSVERHQSVENTPLVHEEGNIEHHATAQGERRNGEEMGPVPTMSAGNTGPAAQSAAAAYATADIDQRSNVTHFAVRPGRINFAIFTRPFYVPSSAIASVSMERVLLTVDAVPDTWHNKPYGDHNWRSSSSHRGLQRP